MNESPLEQVRLIGPKLAARSADIEELRTLPEDVVELVRPTGAFRMYVPDDDLDGPGVTAWESLEIIEELGYHDGAVGWCAAIGSTTSLLSSYLPDPFATEIFGSRDGIAGGFAALNGRAVPVDGGLRVSGTWQWGSGTRHCDWVGGGCLIVDEDGTPTPRADGLAAPFVFFPAEEVEFIDTWHSSGLAGTGSGDYRVTDVFVPEGRWAQTGRDRPLRSNALARFSFFGLLACGVAASAMGIARRSIDELADLAGSKKPQGSSRELRERTPVQADVAIAEATLRSAWSFLRDTVEEAWAAAADGQVPNDEQRRLLRLAATHATQSAAQVAESMYKAAGGAAVYRTSPIQRCFRDTYVATQHAMVAPRTYEVPGRMLLGLETNTAML
ncbi:MAG: acyl-CoA dehydrogenase family protein [Actinomycetota bacterium]